MHLFSSPDGLSTHMSGTWTGVTQGRLGSSGDWIPHRWPSPCGSWVPRGVLREPGGSCRACSNQALGEDVSLLLHSGWLRASQEATLTQGEESCHLLLGHGREVCGTGEVSAATLGRLSLPGLVSNTLKL